VGVVDVTLFNDDVIALAKQSFDGIFQLLGIHATQALTPWAGFKDRFPWLLCNIAGGLLCVAAALALMSLATAATPYPLYGLLLAAAGGGCGLALAPLSGMIMHALPPSHAGVGAGLNSTTRELGSALGVAVFSTILTARFASHLPAALRDLPGSGGQAVRQSVTAALGYAGSAPDPAARAHLIDATRDAFTSGTSTGLRVGAALLLLATVVVALQHPKDSRPE